MAPETWVLGVPLTCESGCKSWVGCVPTGDGADCFTSFFGVWFSVLSPEQFNKPNKAIKKIKVIPAFIDAFLL